MGESLTLAAIGHDPQGFEINLWVVVIMIAIALLILINLMGALRREFCAPHLFLKVAYKPFNSSTYEIGHLTYLAPKGATLITERSCNKGDRLLFNLSSLANYPVQSVSLSGTVTHVVTVSGAYRAEVRFEASLTVPSLPIYIQSLIKGLS